jgi:hypothetical protein
MRFLLLLLLLASSAAQAWQTVTVTAAATIHVTDGRSVTFTASASYYVFERVLVTSKSLWAKPLPIAPVRIVLKCKARYADYWWGSDGLKVGKSAKWLKVWDIGALSRTPGKTYTVNGQRPTVAGEVTGNL